MTKCDLIEILHRNGVFNVGLKFGAKLKKIRIERNMSQDEFATLLGTSKQVISRYENSQRTPKITIAQEYSEKLNIPLEFLIDDSEEDLKIDSNTKSDKNVKDISFDDFTYAFLDESKELTEENKAKLLEMAKFFKQQQEKEKSNLN